MSLNFRFGRRCVGFSRILTRILMWTWGVALCGSPLARPAGPSAFAQESRVATTVQLPTFGVAIDADGQLSVKRFDDPQGQLAAARIAAARAQVPGPLLARSELRKVSLVRLERTLAKRLAAGQAPDDAMQNLAGLHGLRYVFFYPDQRDIVLAGPAEGWAPDAAGRAVGLTSLRPVIRLDDLAAALRAFPPGSRERPFVGCTIDPPAEGLARLREFQKTVPSSVRNNQRDEVAAYVLRGTQESLGLADVRVFGVPANTHLAQVLVEADYRMKCIGIGLEPPPVPMTTFLSALRTPPRQMLQRWWFTPQESCVRVGDKGLAIEFVGQGVELRTEDKVIGPNGQLIASPDEPHPASRAYATSFTTKYPEIASRSPVYAQMRNCIDVLVAAAHLRRENLYQQANWNAELLRDERRLPIETLPTPKAAPCLVNALWKQNRLLAPTGGGVSIDADSLLDVAARLPTDSPVQLLHRESRPAGDDDELWWWD